MNNNLQVQQEEGDEFPALLIGTGLVLASLILVPALAQRVGLGASVTIALRGLLMRAANRARPPGRRFPDLPQAGGCRRRAKIAIVP